MRRARSFFLTLLLMVTLSFSFFFRAHAEECQKIKFMLMDKQGNVRSYEEAIVLRKSGQIIFSEHFIREWISDVENDLRLNPSSEPLKLLYLVGVHNGFITVKVEDEKFWTIEQYSEKISKIKCPSQQVIKKKEPFALADLEAKWLKQENIDDTSKQMVNRYLFFADFEIETGKYQEAKEDLDKAMALWPNNPGVLSRLCKIHLKA
ncbi:MAG: tetratricopeptide repeat protein, partial [Desulfatiglandales bacterium]